MSKFFFFLFTNFAICIGKLNNKFFLGGETVRALQQQSGAKIQIEPVHGATPVDRNVQIIGESKYI